jgi:hypothetical protein
MTTQEPATDAVEEKSTLKSQVTFGYQSSQDSTGDLNTLVRAMEV